MDYLIGLKLSQKYRFAEGAAYQRRALAFAPGYLPAKIQLAQDLLRLGEEAEGWRLADEVQRADAYDVAANNLVTLHDVLAKFQTLTNEHFVLAHAAARKRRFMAAALWICWNRPGCGFARVTACEFSKPVLVEMFNDEKDFAVRTFGMPDNDGFLGVCFGQVITANSPGAQARHAFQLGEHALARVLSRRHASADRNKMPRWISEGISVYEERQANPAWGERLESALPGNAPGRKT